MNTTSSCHHEVVAVVLVIIAVVYTQAPCNEQQTEERKHGEIQRWSMECLSISLGSGTAVQIADEFAL